MMALPRVVRLVRAKDILAYMLKVIVADTVRFHAVDSKIKRYS